MVAASDITQTAPGLGLHQEMAVMQEDAHMPPMKVLQAATSWVANHFRIKDIGSIEVGKLADIDIVDADPTLDIMNMRKLDTVIKDGKVVDRAYHPWFKGDMFSNSHLSYNRDVVDLAWEQDLKAASGGGRRGGGEAAAEGQRGAVPAARARCGSGGRWRNPASGLPTTGAAAVLARCPIRRCRRHRVSRPCSAHGHQGTLDTTFTLTGISFVKRSLVYANGQPMPTTVASATQSPS